MAFYCWILSDAWKVLGKFLEGYYGITVCWCSCVMQVIFGCAQAFIVSNIVCFTCHAESICCVSSSHAATIFDHMSVTNPCPFSVYPSGERYRCPIFYVSIPCLPIVDDDLNILKCNSPLFLPLSNLLKPHCGAPTYTLVYCITNCKICD